MHENMTTIHTPRTTLSTLLVENGLINNNETPSFALAQALATSTQTVATQTLTDLTFPSLPLVEPTATGYYLVNFVGNADITSSAANSGVYAQVSNSGVIQGVRHQFLSHASSGTQGITVALSTVVSATLAPPVFSISVANIASGDSTVWTSRSLTWVKLAG